MLTRLVAVTRKEVLQTLRDRRMMFMLMVAPVIQIGLFGAAVDFDVDRVPTVIVDHDRSPAGRRELARVLADGTLRRVGDAGDESEAQAMLDRSECAVILVVPVGFSRALARGEPAELQVILDGTDAQRGSAAGGAVGQYFRARAPALMRVPVRAGAVTMLPQVLFNPSLRTAVYMVPGVASMLLLMLSVIISAMGLAREREMGTLEQVMVTPIAPTTLLVGKLLPFVAIGTFDFLAAVAAGAVFFGMPLHADPSLVLCATVGYLTACLGIGLFVSTVSNTQQQAFLGGFLIVLPAALLSGVMTPVRSMPDWLQPLTFINPVRWYVEVLRAALLKGAGWEELGGRVLILVVMGAVLLGFSSLRFRRSIA